MIITFVVIIIIIIIKLAFWLTRWVCYLSIDAQMKSRINNIQCIKQNGFSVCVYSANSQKTSKDISHAPCLWLLYSYYILTSSIHNQSTCTHPLPNGI